ncbi:MULTISPECIES: hypothetical protein [Polaromonas]|uniref:Uncharacterized protein n=1 Tax=Polaromonas aquatica TaxID=332657 RepID=A0ABW1TUM8_9BURK
MASTKSGFGALTYAQNLCCGAARTQVFDLLRYQSNSACKLLIYIGSLNCFFSGHSKQSLDLQGFRVNADKLSTKLSTENLEICKAPLNQALRRLFVSVFTDSSTIVYIS